MSNILIIGYSKMSRRWEHALLARLETLGHAVSVRHIEGTPPVAKAMDRVLDMESRRFGRSLASRAEPLPPGPDVVADLVIDLTGGPNASHAGNVLTISFCGHRTLVDGIAALLASGEAQAQTCLDGAVVGRARPMLGDRVWLSRIGNDLLAGAISLVAQSVVRYFAGGLTPLAEAPKTEPWRAGFLRSYVPHMMKGLAQRVGQKLGRRPFYWQVAYRLIDGPGIAETGCLDGTPFTVLADDGHRFYADPFVIEHDNRLFLFVEEFEYAKGRGTISVAELGADGRLSVPRVVLEEPHHLSYPQIFAMDGEIFMLPESSAARELVLYRAELFPDRWVRDTVLMTDRDFNDATLLQSGGPFWLFGTERFGHGSASDTMTVHSAPSLCGPWTSHALNPIAIDHSAARPGGAFIRQGDKIVLPVQDGSRAYGGGLGLMDLMQVDEGDVVFAPVRPVEGGTAWARKGIHTLNRAGRLEVIDSAG
ncbi:MAG: hypothetical protein JWL86_1198 [Rhizobium sp.]|nr:hypothetical protein [Rhizobium sp.]